MRVLAILLFVFSVAVAVAHAKEIVYRGGLIVFSIPSGWVEEYEPEGGGTFYAKEPDSGTLRLSVLTFKAKDDATISTPAHILASFGSLRPADIRILPNGNALGEEIQRSVEDGEKITLYWWYIASSAPDQHFRVANFSYTVLSSQEGTPRVEADLKFLRASIMQAHFSPKLGK